MEKIYAYSLSVVQKGKIKKAIREVFKEIGYVPPLKVYGKTLEDRGSQMSYSFLGRTLFELGAKGVRLKEKWTRENTPLKLKITGMLQKRLPEFEVRAAGFTTIDIVKRGIDKAYGIRQIEKYLHVPIKKMVFIGDALFPGGNDAAVKKTGVQTVAVRGPKETIAIIKNIIGD